MALVRVTACTTYGSELSTHYAPKRRVITHINNLARLCRPQHSPSFPPTHQQYFRGPNSGLRQQSLFRMPKNSHIVPLAYRGPGEQRPVTTMENSPTASQLLPPELLLKIAELIGVAVDLQNLRLVNRAFSKAATTVLQDGSSRIYLLPTRPSMTRFTKITQNKLIAPEITQVIILYRPPYASPAPPACRAIAENYGMPRQKVEEMVSEYNDMCVDTSYATDAEAPLQEMNVVESGELERVLGEGVQRLTSLRSVSFRSDLDLPRESLTCLNMPRFLRYGLINADGGKFDLIHDITVEEYARYEILRCMHSIQLGHGSPTYALGALQYWLPGIGGECRDLHFLVSKMGSPCESHWLKGLHNRTGLIGDCLVNITRISLTFDGRQPSPTLAAEFDYSGEEFADLALGPHWCTLLQSAVNLEALHFSDVSSWSAGFDNLLHHTFQNCTWPKLAELSIVRDNNIKVLPLAPHNFGYSQGWYLFQQKDMDSFLLRHKQSLKRLELYNIVGLDQRTPAPPLSLQYFGQGFLEDPTTSLQALDDSMNVWQRELDKLADLHVAIGIDFHKGAESPVTLDTWLRDSEIQAFAETLGVSAGRTGSTVGHGNHAVFHLKCSVDRELWDDDFGF